MTFVGRLASYKYFNMDQAILNAMELFDNLVKEKKITSAYVTLGIRWPEKISN